MKYTSAEAGKLVKRLEGRVRDILFRESKASVFHAASVEDPEQLRPDYNFAATEKEAEKLNAEIRKVKHAINVFNATHELPGFRGLTIDQALVYLPQLSSRKQTLHEMAVRLPRERINDYRSSASYVDYEIINYDLEEVTAEYNRVSELLANMHMALDEINNSERFEIDLECV